MFIELTNEEGTVEYVNINHIKRVCTCEAGSSVEWINAPIWHNNPTDFESKYKESYKDVVSKIDHALYESEEFVR